MINHGASLAFCAAEILSDGQILADGTNIPPPKPNAPPSCLTTTTTAVVSPCRLARTVGFLLVFYDQSSLRVEARGKILG